MAKKNKNDYNVITDTGVLDSNDNKDKSSVIYASAINDDEVHEGEQSENEDKRSNLKKLVTIVIPLVSEKSWIDKHDGKDYGEMHFIIADNIYLAKNKLFKYLSKNKNNKAENIILDTHGGGAGWIYLDNIDGTAEAGKNYYGIDELKSIKNASPLVKRNIPSLKMIMEKVEQDGNVIFLGCAMAKGSKGIQFMKEVHKFNYKTNTYASEAFNIGTLQAYIPDNSYYSQENRYYECIDWSSNTPLASGGVHQNKIKQGFKLMEARTAKYVDLANIGKYSGNLLLNGIKGDFIY
jgi:hypothetical protein